MEQDKKLLKWLVYKIIFLGRRKAVGEMNTTKTDWVLWLKFWIFSTVWRHNTHHCQKPLKVIRLKVYWGYYLDVRAGKFQKAGENCVMKGLVVCNWLTCVGKQTGKLEVLQNCCVQWKIFVTFFRLHLNFYNSYRIFVTAHGVTFQMHASHSGTSYFRPCHGLC